MISAGQALITGVSLIVTVNEHCEMPHELLAVQITEVVPEANVEPEAGVQDTVGEGDPTAVGLVQVAM